MSGKVNRSVRTANAVAAAVAGILYGASGVSFADDQPAAAAPAEPSGTTTTTENLQEVVVTASAAAVKKLDASYNIVTVSAEDLKNANPVNVAEAFKLSPGIWPEGSGGQTGANIDIAGFPNGGGDSPYFTTMIQGSPLYGSPDLSFMDSSSMVRLDDTVERMEIVQGGTSAIYGPGQAGAVANFVLKTGSDKPEASVGVTYGTEGMERVDAFVSGRLFDGWYGSIGGFYRKSDGVRDPQYPSDIGGQLTATLKHTLDHGYIMFWARALSDKNQWVADFPYIVNGSSVSPYPGFNQLNSTYNSRALQNFMVPDPNGNGFQNDDLSDGRGAQLSYFGSELNLKFDNGISLHNNFIFDGGYLNTHALISGSTIQTLGTYLDSLTLPSGLTAANVSATYASGAAVPLNQETITQSVWDVQKKLTSVIDEFRVAYDLGGGNTLTGGLYLAHYTDNDNWELGATALVTNQPNAQPIILTGEAGGNIYQVSSPQGIVDANGGYNILEQGKATNVAAYLSDSWLISQWLFDASVRLEHIDLDDWTSNLAPVQMGTVYDLWDNAVSLPDGTWTHRSEHNTLPTWSLGANYEFSDHMSAYVRINDGVFFNNFDAVRCNINNGSNGCSAEPPIPKVQNYEVGYKIQNQWTYLDASIYDKEFKGLTQTPVNSQDVVIGPTTTYGTTSKGLRLIGSVNPLASSDLEPLRSFKILVNGNYEKAHYKDFIGCYIYTNVAGATECADINGAQLARLPKVQVRVTPSDTQSFSWGTITESVTYEYIGQHYQDGTGLNPLGSYYDLAAGIFAAVGDNWEFRINGSNLTDQLGLTEGNARVGGNAVVGGVGFGRSILGREVNFSAKYKFF